MLGHDIAAALPGLRAQAESRMRDSVVVRRPSGDGEPDPLTGVDVPAYALAAVYAGPCRVKAVSLQPRDVESATSTVTTQALELHVPDDAPALQPGDVAFMAADTYTTRIRGRVYRVTGEHAGSDTTAQRVPVIVLPGVAS